MANVMLRRSRQLFRLQTHGQLLYNSGDLGTSSGDSEKRQCNFHSERVVPLYWIGISSVNMDSRRAAYGSRAYEL
ncbi:hypothetical protein PsorP6_010252 [Peronosclerospora sorghi]|uniref:Uncharacterized protein n=1 Tax=Peronosclerospora sorghi TaxID=230839 RepID=A0ACC0VWK5_9STRA|nr:hypothetical protein PsorP6_010252 [Peronosclerospora sorghi]